MKSLRKANGFFFLAALLNCPLEHSFSCRRCLAPQRVGCVIQPMAALAKRLKGIAFTAFRLPSDGFYVCLVYYGSFIYPWIFLVNQRQKQAIYGGLQVTVAVIAEGVGQG